MIFRSIEAGLNSNVGCKRKNNQDNALASRGVYVVCDGMGGGKGGERASAQVAACFSQLAEQPSRNRTSIEHALSQSQQQVLELGQELGGIAGTTITGVVLPTRVEDSVHEQAIDEYCYVINVGDSRTYHMRADAEGHWMAESLTRITRDHSERQNAIDTGEMLPDEANRYIPRNIITQCVGAPDGIQPDWYAARSTDVSSSALMACTRRSIGNCSPMWRPHMAIRKSPRICWCSPRSTRAATTTSP